MGVGFAPICSCAMRPARFPEAVSGPCRSGSTGRASVVDGPALTASRFGRRYFNEAVTLINRASSLMAAARSRTNCRNSEA